MRIVAGDIGGTHARFALAELTPGGRPAIGEMHRYRTREHQGLVSAWRAFQRDCGGVLPAHAALGVAAPMTGDVLRFVNSGWTIDRNVIADELGVERLHILNDFGAVAHAVSVMEPGELEHLTGPDEALPTEGPVTVMGPGTGLGVALLLRRGGRIEVVETEAAHIGFAPLTRDEQALAEELAARYGRVSVERIVAGPGLIDLYRHFGGGDWDIGDAGGLWSAAVEGRDAIAAQALDQLVKCLGSAAGDIALAHGAVAMVVTGGLAYRMRERLAGPLFAGRFIAKGRYQGHMRRIMVKRATYEEPGLLGAAVAFQRRFGA